MAITDAPTPTPIAIPADQCATWASRIREDLTQARGSLANHHVTIQSWRKLLENNDPEDKPYFVGGSTLTDSFCKAACFSLTAEVVSALLATDPILQYSNPTELGKLCGQRLNDFIQALGERYLSLTRKVTQTFYQGFVDGGCVVLTNWRTQIADRMDWKQDLRVAMVNDEETGQPNLVIEPGKMTPVAITTPLYDFPDFTIIPMDRVFTFPSQQSSLQQSPGVAIQLVLTGEDLIQGVKDGVYDRKAVEAIMQHQPDASEQLTPEDERFDVSAWVTRMSEDEEFCRQTYTCMEVWWERTKTGSIGTVVDWHILLHEATSTIFHAQPWQVWGQHTRSRRPLAFFKPYGFGDGIQGDSVASMGGQTTQEGKTALLRLAISQMQRHLTRRSYVAMSMYEDLQEKLGPDAADEFNALGALVPVPDALLESGHGLTPIDEGDSPTLVLPLIERIDYDGQKGVGSNDMSMGTGMSGSITATEAMQMSEGQKRVLGLILANAADFLTELGDMLISLLVQHQGRKSVQNLWDETHMAQEQDVPLSLALDFPYTITANAAREIQNRVLRRQNAAQLYQVWSQVPQIVQNPERLYHMIAYVSQELAGGMQIPSDILGKVEEWVQGQQASPTSATTPGVSPPLPPSGPPVAMAPPQMAPAAQAVPEQAQAAMPTQVGGGGGTPGLPGAAQVYGRG